MSISKMGKIRILKTDNSILREDNRKLREIAIKIIDNAKSHHIANNIQAWIPLTLLAELEEVADNPKDWANRIVSTIENEDKLTRLAELSRKTRFENETGWKGLANIYSILTGLECDENLAMGLATSAANDTVRRLERARNRIDELWNENKRLREEVRVANIHVKEKEQHIDYLQKDIAIYGEAAKRHIVEFSRLTHDWRILREANQNQYNKIKENNELVRFHDYVEKYFPHAYRNTTVNLKAEQHQANQANQEADRLPYLQRKVSQNPIQNPPPEETSNQPLTDSLANVPNHLKRDTSHWKTCNKCGTVNKRKEKIESCYLCGSSL